jgi:hypothetical protein
VLALPGSSAQPRLLEVSGEKQRDMLRKSTTHRRIVYPHGSWFALRNAVFEHVIPALLEKRSPHLYLAMYERAQRNPSKSFRANYNDLAEMVNCDARTARHCIRELLRRHFVKEVKGGKLRSRTDKPKYKVHLADESLDSGEWFPVPRFLVTQYLRKYEGSAVLFAVLSIQHLKWRSEAWAGLKHYADMLGMKPRRVYAYLTAMAHQSRWEKLGTNLPRPLELTYSSDGKRRHFSVRAAQFYIPHGRQQPAVKLSEEFKAYFGLGRKRSKRD